MPPSQSEADLIQSAFWILVSCRPMKRWETVTIVGVGLIGGSIGLALRQRGLAEQIIGVGRSREKLEKAQGLGIIDTATTSIEQSVADADLVVVCTPVATIVPQIQQLATACRPGSLITDVGSTKATMAHALREPLAEGVYFVGSHPLAGSEQSGFEHASADLFVDRVTVVTPTSETRAEDEAAVGEFWSSLGSTVVSMSPEEHDKALAMTSHLPHVAASATAAVTPIEYLNLVAGGWTDTTRVAAGEVELWRQILVDNRNNIVESIDQLIEKLQAFRDSLASGDEEKLIQLLNAGKQNRDALGS
jgi:cyclohexadieny/prephenate dehydrogenase